MGFQSSCGNVIWMDSPKLPTKVPSPIPYRPIWVNNALSFVEKENFINIALSKYVEFWK
jgi:hypothetical protein